MRLFSIFLAAIMSSSLLSLSSTTTVVQQQETVVQKMPFHIPLIALDDSAAEVNLEDIFVQDNAAEWTIGDFWTTKCVRCPAAMDHLNSAVSKNVRGLTLCCTPGCDEAREILDRDDDDDSPRKWSSLHHYAVVDKERAKDVFGFASVPYYVLHRRGQGIVYQGGDARVVWQLIATGSADDDNNNKKEEKILETGNPSSPTDARAFELDDLDF